MTEHTEEGRKEGQQGKKSYFSREKHKPQKRIKSKTKGKVEMERRNKKFLFVPFSSIAPKGTSLNTSSTDKNFHHIIFFFNKTGNKAVDENPSGFSLQEAQSQVPGVPHTDDQNCF